MKSIFLLILFFLRTADAIFFKPKRVEGITIMNGAIEVGPLSNNTSIDISLYPDLNFKASVRAFVGARFASAKFIVDGVVIKTDSSPPFESGIWAPTVGIHTIQVKGFRRGQGKGKKIGSKKLTFIITNSKAPKAPASTPKAPPQVTAPEAVPVPVTPVAPMAPVPVAPMALVPVAPKAPMSPLAPVPVAPISPVTAPVVAPISPVTAPVVAPIAPVTSPVVAPIAPVTAPVAPLAPVDAPIAPVTAPIFAPIAPVDAPIAPVDAPIAPVDAPIAPVTAPVVAPLAPVAVVPIVTVPFRLSAGDQVVASSETWFADSPYVTGGTIRTLAAAVSTPKLDALTRKGRFATSLTDKIQYKIPIANGEYYVILLFAEFDDIAVGQRVFQPIIEDQMQGEIDIYEVKGGKYNRYNPDYFVTVSGGTLDIGFEAVTGFPMICGIEILYG